MFPVSIDRNYIQEYNRKLLQINKSHFPSLQHGDIFIVFFLYTDSQILLLFISVLPVNPYDR